MVEEKIVKINVEPPLEGIKEWFWPASDPSLKDEKYVGGWTRQRDDWEKFHFEKYHTHIRNFNVVVQAGACAGMYPRLLSKRFKTVYTFEIDETCFQCLINNCYNTEGKVIAFNAALSDSHKMVGIRSNGFVGEDQVIEGGNIPSFMIDDLVLSQCDLIWLDVEGHEAQALFGAVNTIMLFNPVVICEDHKNNQEALIFLKSITDKYEFIERSGSDNIYAV